MSTFPLALSSLPTTPAPLAASRLYTSLTPSEQLSLLSADLTGWGAILQLARFPYNHHPYSAGRVERVGIPGLQFSDGPRGVSLGGGSTCFPTPGGRGCSWDVGLEKEVGRAIGRELLAQGANLFGGICVNLAPHPAWGRAQESYGEDSLILGSMGAALARGVKPYAIPVVKHFALNSMENMRFSVNVLCSPQTLHQTYLPHFLQTLTEGGAEGLMTCYNSINGVMGGESGEMIEGVVRGEWGMEGVVVISDFLWGLRDGPKSVQAGMDVEFFFRNIRHRSLPSALSSGIITPSQIQRIGERVLTAQLGHAARVRQLEARGEMPGREVVGCEEHLELARRVAAAGMVLLKNDELLPWGKGVKKVLVVGELAMSAQTGDQGSSAVRPREVITPLAGIRALADEGVEIAYHDGKDLPSTIRAAKEADAVFLLLGLTGKEEGESFACVDPGINIQVLPWPFGTWIGAQLLRVAAGVMQFFTGRIGGDRDHLRLKERDERLAEALAREVGGKVVLAVSAGGTIVLPDTVMESTAAILYTGYGGCQFGHALSDVLWGRAEPSGRLISVIPEKEDDLGPWDPWAKEVTYGRWWGYRKLRKEGAGVRWPFGWGMGYGRFELTGWEGPGELVGRFFEVEVGVKNTSGRESAVVVQVYGGKAGVLEEDEYTNVLLGFSKESLLPGQTRRVLVKCRSDPMAFYDVGRKMWGVREGRYVIRVGQYEGDVEGLEKEYEVKGGLEWPVV